MAPGSASQFRWSPIERWLPDGIADMPVDHAGAELVQHGCGRSGRATRDDIQWWTGCPSRATTKALAAIDVVEVDLDGGGTGYAAGRRLEPTETPEPWVALLPALDATTMGWKDRDWYLGGYRAALFDRAGNAGPTIWVDGRIVGGWAQSDGGEIALYLLEDVGAETMKAIDHEAARLAEWIAPTSAVAFLGSAVRAATRPARVDTAVAPDLRAAEERVGASGAASDAESARQASTTSSEPGVDLAEFGPALVRPAGLDADPHERPFCPHDVAVAGGVAVALAVADEDDRAPGGLVGEDAVALARPTNKATRVAVRESDRARAGPRTWSVR